MTLKQIAEVLQQEFIDGPSGLPDGFIVINYRPAKGKKKAEMDLTIGGRDITVDDRADVVGSGTSLMPIFKIVKTRRKLR